MNTQNLIKTAVAAVIMVFAATCTVSSVLGQSKRDVQSSAVSNWGSGPSLVGVWEQENAPMEYDCGTGQPLPGTPTIRIMQTFNEGGTGWMEDTAPVEGPYRSTGSTLWRHISRLGYSYTSRHYSFLPDNTFIFLVTVRGNVVLRPDGQVFNETGQFELKTPDGTVVYTGCFRGTANRLGM